ncbi:ATP-dependent RNA helicase SUPV3L1/SUV3 [Bartonella sp. AR 15-3]|nr:ATP-dependent RNA helicase SUPV3L1/SUV3 [Bartonella sp. AR 15-3]
MIMESKIIHKDDVLIEKSGSGRFEGFRFYINKSNIDKETDEQNNFDNESLIAAFTKRATRFCAAANGDFTLSSDGIIRWIGQPVGQLIATTDILKPKVLLLADVQLTGESRDQVIARLERFVIFHFETTLKPLLDLRNANNLTDSTAQFASRLFNSLGILPRRSVAQIVKNLDQEARRNLRQLGIRFGAFNIYVMGMLKPAPIQALTLLWCLKNKNSDQTGLNEILAALNNGRTSFVVDPTYNPTLYRLAGYQILGNRAVRIDILERLANLIRSTLHWKPGLEPKPDGAYDGKSFFVTPAMMSNLGANETDMNEILKGLGYQSHRYDNSVPTKNLAHEHSSHNTSITTALFPEAECVGDLWKTIQQSNTLQAEIKTTSSLEQSPCATDCLPKAEPVGDFVKHMQNTAENKTVLLWSYHPQQTQHYRNRDNSKQKQQEKHKKTSTQESNTHYNTSQKKPLKAQHSYKDNKKKTASLHKKSLRTQNYDSNSPFAKLAVLRDQLKRDKDARL